MECCAVCAAKEFQIILYVPAAPLISVPVGLAEQPLARPPSAVNSSIGSVELILGNRVRAETLHSREEATVVGQMSDVT